ncbi:M24 family metallopeptidase [Elioraea sp.]|uniref:M24 family metallopeptidase n=1 Tax=Elioraea sp. TaxID=2185103 RepID=UPI003F6EC169
MSKHDFSATEFIDRLTRARAAVAAAKLDWMVLFHPVSILWLTGGEAKSYRAFQCLLLAADDRPLTMITNGTDVAEWRDDSRADEVIGWAGPEPEDPIEVFARVARAHGLLDARVGIEVPGFYLHPSHYTRIRDLLGGALVAEPSNLIHELKAVKSPAELAFVREAAARADAAMTALFGAIRDGAMELELAAEAHRALLASGCTLPASQMNLVTGERLCYPIGGPTQRRMARGDAGTVEVGAAFRRYTATLGRQFSLGEPSRRVREVFAVVKDAGEAMLAEIRDGVAAVVPHEAAKRVIAAAGLDRYRLHTSGYGLVPGFPPSWGDPTINLFGGSKSVLRAGMVVTIEPPVFIHEERVGARMIDNIIVTETGCEVLSQVPREIAVRG